MMQKIHSWSYLLEDKGKSSTSVVRILGMQRMKEAPKICKKFCFDKVDRRYLPMQKYSSKIPVNHRKTGLLCYFEYKLNKDICNNEKIYLAESIVT